MSTTKRLAAGLAAAMLAAGAQAQMTTGTWVNTAGGNWSDAGSWDPSGAPSATAFLISNGVYTITLDQNVVIGTVRLWAQSPTVVVPAGQWLSVTNTGGTGGNDNNGMTFNSSSGTQLIIDGGIVTNRGYYLTGTSTILITNGGSMVVLAGSPRINDKASLTLDGGSYVHTSTLDFGYNASSGAHVYLNLRSGSALFGSTVYVGARGGATINIDGATVTNLGTLSVGRTAPSGTSPQTGIVSITSGSLVHARDLIVGDVSVINANLAQFNISGGLYNNISNQTIRIGNTSTGSLNVAGGEFRATSGAPFYIGNSGQARGVGFVTNSGGTMALGNATLQKGLWTINGGDVSASSITATLADGAFNFQSGTLNVGSMTVANGSAFTVGNGVSDALLALRGNSSFADGLALSSGAALIVSNTAIHSLTGDISGNAGLLKAGSGWMTLRGANTYAGGTTNAAGILEAVAPGALPGYDSAGTVITRSGATLAVLATGEAGEWTSTDIDTLLASATWNTGSRFGIDVASNSFTYGSAISGAKGFVKLGAGTLTLNGANNYSGATAVHDGTLILGAGTQLSSTADLLLGNPLSTTTGGTLDLSGGSQTVSKLFTAAPTNSNSSANNAIIIPAGQVLNVVTSAATRSVHIQDGTHLQVSGAGALNVTNTPGRILVWGQRSTDGSTYRGLDLSGLGSFSADMNDIVVGYDESAASQASRQALLALAGTNTIRAASAVYVGFSTTDGSVRGRMLLGVSNRIETANLRIGYGKATGWVTFQDGLDSPSLVLVGPNGTDRANVALGQFNQNNSGTQPNGFLMITNEGASIDASIDTLLIGSLDTSGSGAAAGGRGYATVNAGTVDANTVIVGRSLAAATQGTGLGVLTWNGGTLTVNSTFVLGQMNGGGTISGTFALNGGTATLATDLVDGGGTSEVTMDGGTLDMQGHTIGSAASIIDTLTIRSGTLRNVAGINGGVGWSKTGTGTLTVEGVNTYDSNLNIDAGTVRYNGTYTGSGMITVQNGATLGGTGSVGNVATASGGALAPGNSAGTLTVGDLTLDGGTTLEYELGTASDLIVAQAANLGGIEFDDFTFIPGTGFGPGIYTLIDATSISGLGASTLGTIGSYSAELSINSGTQDLVLTVVPEPATLGLLGAATLVALLRRRMR